MKLHSSALALALAYLTLPSAQAAQIKSINFNGSGCPVPESQSLPFGFDGQWLTVDFAKGQKSVRVTKGRDTSLEESRRNCSLTLSVNIPDRQRMALERVVAWGQYQLGDGDQFTFSLDNFFQGQSKTGDIDVSALGPSSRQNYTFDRNISSSNLNWSPCGGDRALTLNAAVRVAPRNADGDRDTWSQGKLDKIAFRFTYQKCN